MHVNIAIIWTNNIIYIIMYIIVKKIFWIKRSVFDWLIGTQNCTLFTLLRSVVWVTLAILLYQQIFSPFKVSMTEMRVFDISPSLSFLILYSQNCIFFLPFQPIDHIFFCNFMFRIIDIFFLMPSFYSSEHMAHFFQRITASSVPS